jgi:hypothetical protein
MLKFTLDQWTFLYNSYAKNNLCKRGFCVGILFRLICDFQVGEIVRSAGFVLEKKYAGQKGVLTESE